MALFHEAFGEFLAGRATKSDHCIAIPLPRPAARLRNAATEHIERKPSRECGAALQVNSAVRLKDVGAFSLDDVRRIRPLISQRERGNTFGRETIDERTHTDESDGVPGKGELLEPGADERRRRDALTPPAVKKHIAFIVDAGANHQVRRMQLR